MGRGGRTDGCHCKVEMADPPRTLGWTNGLRLGMVVESLVAPGARQTRTRNEKPETRASVQTC